MPNKHLYPTYPACKFPLPKAVDALPKQTSRAYLPRKSLLPQAGDTLPNQASIIIIIYLPTLLRRQKANADYNQCPLQL